MGLPRALRIFLVLKTTGERDEYLELFEKLSTDWSIVILVYKLTATRIFVINVNKLGSLDH